MGAVDMELWLLFINTVPVSSNNLQLQNRNMNPNGYLKCHAYNYNGNCNRQFCFYNHSCLQCSCSHPIVYCGGVRRDILHRPQCNSGFAQRQNVRIHRPNVNNYSVSFRTPQPNTRPRFSSAAMGQRSYTD